MRTWRQAREPLHDANGAEKFEVSRENASDPDGVHQNEKRGGKQGTLPDRQASMRQQWGYHEDQHGDAASGFVRALPPKTGIVRGGICEGEEGTAYKCREKERTLELGHLDFSVDA